MTRWALFLWAVVLTAGCTTQPERVYVQEPLPVPPAPATPEIPAEELECLDQDAYVRLVERDVVLQSHIERLEDIIRTTHGDDSE